MLDECKGGKFEEVIRCFAIAVLRKEVYRKLESGSATMAGYSEALTAQNNLTAKQRERLLPLVLAHQKILQGNLNERRRLSEKFDDRKRRLNDAHTRLTEKRRLLLARQGELPAMSPEELESVSHHVLEAWVGNEQWVETLIRGGPGDVDSRRSQKRLRGGMEQISGTAAQEPSDSPARSLLAELNDRIGKQELRLQKWAQFRASLATPQQSKKPTARKQTVQPILEFTAHREPQPTASCTKPILSIPDREQCHIKGMDLIQAMRLELASTRTTSTRSNNPLNDFRDPFYDSANVLATGCKGGKAQVPDSVNTDSPDIPTGKDSAETSTRALEKGRREHHDAKADTKFPSPSTAGESEETTLASEPHGGSRSPSPSLNLSDHQDLLSINAALLTTPCGEHSGSIPAPDISQCGSVTKGSKQFSPCGDGQALTSPSPHFEENILVQKTPRTPDTASLTPAGPTTDLHSQSDLPFSPPKPQAPDLLERTRKSMALFSPSSEAERVNQKPLNMTSKHRQRQKEKPNQQPRPTSQLFPEDHFQPPAKPKPKPKPNPEHVHQNHTPTTTPTVHKNDQIDALDQQSLSPNGIPTSGSSTPRDQLFSDQADYASVFKSRPRVAVSPPLASSPERSGNSGFLEERMQRGRLELDDDDDENESENEFGRSPYQGLELKRG